MFRYFVTTVLLLICGVGAFAQSEQNDVYQHRHQVGLNTTLFIKQFLSFSDNNILFDNPYLFTYKYMGSRGRGLRAGLGFAFMGNKNSSSGNTTIIPDSSQGKIYLRAGYEKQLVLAKHWIAYGGIDARYQSEKTKVSSTIATFPQNQVSTITTKNLNVGLGPVLGMEFVINKRMSLNVEASVMYFYNERREKLEDSRFPSLNTDSYSSQSTASVSVPTTLFFVVKL